MFFAKGCILDKTEIPTFERARELADSMSGKVTLAMTNWTPRYGPPSVPVRYMVYLWNWQTKRYAYVHYEEDLAEGLEYVGVLNPSKPSAPPYDPSALWH